MEYIVLDLEWNQSNTGKEDAVEKLPFEIIEIGAIKLNNERVMVSEFNELIKPQVYHEMHKITSKLIHIQMQELERGRPFPEVGGDFVRWCGQEEQLFCTWDIAASQQVLTMRITTLMSKAMAAVDRIGIAVRLKMKAKGVRPDRLPAIMMLH